MASIFISHSAKDSFAAKVRDGIAQKLEGLNFKVLLDKNRLQPGDMWRAKLHKWMGICDGAIILFSRNALDSDWVLKETTILTWRKSLQPGLKLIPVLLGDVRASETGIESYKPLQIRELEFIRLEPNEQDADENENVNRLIDKVIQCFKKFEKTNDKNPVNRWVEDVESKLKHADDIHLKRAAESLNIATDDLADFSQYYKTIAHQLLHADLRSTCVALDVLKKSMTREYMESLIALIMPNLVQLDTVRNILPITQNKPEKRFLAINADYEITGDCYIRRATCNASCYLIKTSNMIGEEDPELSFEDAICKKLNISGNRSSEQIRKVIEMIYSITSRLIFFIIGKPFLNERLLKKLLQKYSLPTVVLLSGTEFPTPKEVGSFEPEFILPKLKIGEEDELNSNISIIESTLNT